MLKSKLVVWTFIVVTGFYMLVSLWNIAVFPDKTWTVRSTDSDYRFWKYGEWFNRCILYVRRSYVSKIY
ncbi:hypothetical protein QUF51_08620 [Bacillus pumilus]|nr:hypothetical protein [Bacillus pumilus]